MPDSVADAESWGQSSLDMGDIHCCPPCVISYMARTQLAGGKLAVLVDPGSWNNLAGALWAQQVAREAVRCGLKSQIKEVVRTKSRFKTEIEKLPKIFISYGNKQLVYFNLYFISLSTR